MRLNTECIRDVMIRIEEDLCLMPRQNGRVQMEPMNISHLYEQLTKHSQEEIFYALFNLEQAGYVDLTIVWSDDNVALVCRVNYMTYAGHEFLARIRDNKRWAVVKNGLLAIRDYSLSAISAVAEGVANAAIGKFVEKIDL